MDSVSFFILPLQMQMSAQESPAWTLSLAKIWLADITATVFGDGPDKTVTSVSISSLKVTSKFLSFHWRLPLLATYKRLLLGIRRCSSASLAFPTCGNPFLSRLGKLKLQLCLHHDWTCMPSSSLWIQCMPSYSLHKVDLTLLAFTSCFFSKLRLNLCTSRSVDYTLIMHNVINSHMETISCSSWRLTTSSSSSDVSGCHGQCQNGATCKVWMSSS